MSAFLLLRGNLCMTYILCANCFSDYTRFDQLYPVDPKHMAATEYSRHVSWMGRELLPGQLKVLSSVKIQQKWLKISSKAHK